MIRLFNHYLSVRMLALTTIESVVLFQALLVGYSVRLDNAGTPPYFEAALFSAVLVISMSAVGMYRNVVPPWRPMFQRLIAAYAVALVVMSVVFYMFQDIYVGRGVLLYATVLGLVGVVLVRLTFFRLSDLDGFKRRLLVIGSEQAIEDLQLGEGRAPTSRNFRICGVYGVCPDREAGIEPGSRDHAQLMQMIRQLKISDIVLGVKDQRGGVLPLRQLLDCKLAGIRVMDLVSFYERESGRLPLDTLRASWLIAGPGFDVGGWRDALKRTVDLMASTVLLIVASPVILLAMAAIWIDTGGPILYRQQRVGQGGRVFTIFKLRSMRQDAERNGAARWAEKNDARITRVGRFIRATRIDELPQLINVLRGDMSFVGPRPERPEMVADLTHQIPFYEVRHSLKPGITGWAQVRYQYGSTLEAAKVKQQYDLYYVKNHSLLLDLLIMIETIEVVVLRKGAL